MILILYFYKLITKRLLNPCNPLKIPERPFNDFHTLHFKWVELWYILQLSHALLHCLKGRFMSLIKLFQICSKLLSLKRVRKHFYVYLKICQSLYIYESLQEQSSDKEVSNLHWKLHWKVSVEPNLTNVYFVNIAISHDCSRFADSSTAWFFCQSLSANFRILRYFSE